MNPIILYDNRFLDVPAIAATDTDQTGDYDVRNIRDTRPYLLHRFASLGTKYYTVNCGSTKAADCLGIFSHNLGSVAAAVSVESSTDNFGAVTTQRLAPVSPTHNRARLAPFNTASNPDWRVKIVTAGAAAQAGCVVLGSRLEFPRPPIQPFVPYEEDVKSLAPDGDFGAQIEAAIKYHPIKISARFQNLDRAWIENTFRPFWDSWMKKEKWFFFAWNLDDYPQHVFYVRRGRGYKFKMPLSKGYLVKEFTIELEGYSEF